MSADHLFITAAQHLCWSSICPQSCLHLVIPLSHYLPTQKLFSVINFLSAYHSYVTSKWSHSLVSVKCLIFNLLKVNILNWSQISSIYQSSKKPLMLASSLHVHHSAWEYINITDCSWSIDHNSTVLWNLLVHTLVHFNTYTHFT